MWYKDAGQNFMIPVPSKFAPPVDHSDPLAKFDDDLSRAIVDAEVNSSQWTLMHR